MHTDVHSLDIASKYTNKYVYFYGSVCEQANAGACPQWLQVTFWNLRVIKLKFWPTADTISQLTQTWTTSLGLQSHFISFLKAWLREKLSAYFKQWRVYRPKKKK